MFDAAGKLPPGVLKGSLYWIGDYEECLGIAQDPGATQLGISAHYCSATIGQNPEIVCLIINACTTILNNIWNKITVGLC